ncbi:uncharacterized protein LOC143287423 [Babylonia areolata]|uniref:uncharacterized protein LOC143287423 n=1 Tax=Babylonia areolata TaxID=304850 RepID=UPI003FD2EF7F
MLKVKTSWRQPPPPPPPLPPLPTRPDDTHSHSLPLNARGSTMGGQHSSCTHPKTKCYHAGSPKTQVVRVAPPDLTSKQKALLRTAWDQLERDIANVGIITFLGMFETHPQVQEVFMPFVGLAKTDEQHSKTLRQHALRVMATVEKCIHRLDEPERMRTVLEALGGRHIGYNAKIEYVDVLGSQFVKAVKDNSATWSDDIENAWLSLVRIITFYVKLGWMEKQKLHVTRDVTRKENLPRTTLSREGPAPTDAKAHQLSAKHANGGAVPAVSNVLSAAPGKETPPPGPGPEPGPAENGKAAGHDTKPSQPVSMNSSGTTAVGSKAGNGVESCGKV